MDNYIIRDKSTQIINKTISITLVINSMIFLIVITLIVNKNYRHELNDNQLRQLSVNNVPFADLRKKRAIVDLINHSFSGRWNSMKQVPGFDYNEGLIRLFYQNYFTRNKNSFYNFIIFIHDGNDKKKWIFIQNTYPISILDNSTNLVFNRNITIINTKVSIEMNELEIFDILSRKFADAEFEIRYPSDENSINSVLNLSTHGSLKSQDLDVTFNVQIEKNSIYTKISNFSVILCVIGTIQLLNSKYLLEQFTDNSNFALKVKIKISINNFSIHIFFF